MRVADAPIPANLTASALARLEKQAAILSLAHTIDVDKDDLRALLAYRASAEEEREALRRERNRYRQLFDECAIARDTAGFLGSVPECIEALDGEIKLATARAEAAEAALADKDAMLKEAVEVLHSIATIGTKSHVDRVGDMYDLAGGYAETVIFSDEAEVARAFLDKIGDK